MTSFHHLHDLKVNRVLEQNFKENKSINRKMVQGLTSSYLTSQGWRKTLVGIEWEKTSCVVQVTIHQRFKTSKLEVLDLLWGFVHLTNRLSLNNPYPSLILEMWCVYVYVTNWACMGGFYSEFWRVVTSWDHMRLSVGLEWMHATSLLAQSKLYKAKIV